MSEDREIKKALAFVKPEKGPKHYIKRYLNEPNYKEWFHRNYPDYTIYQGIGISEIEFKEIVEQLTGSSTNQKEGYQLPEQEKQQQQQQQQPQQTFDNNSSDNSTVPQEQIQDTEHKTPETTDGITKLKELAEKLHEYKREKSSSSSSLEQESQKENEQFTEISTRPDDTTSTTTQDIKGEDLAKSVFDSYSDEQTNYDRRTFEEFVDERVLISRDLFGKKEMKIKILEVSDEHQESKIRWKFGDRVKVNKIIVTIKHLDSMEVEEGEFDIEAIEKELAEKRHYSSTNRWIPATDIKNGYVVNSKHTALISDAVALDYIVF